MTADPGSWSGDQPITFTYQWSDDPTNDNDTDADTLSPADDGQSVTVTVTATNDAGQASATSDSFGPVVFPAPVNNVAPGISGNPSGNSPPQPGDTLTVSDGTWSNDPSLSYAWEDCDDSGNNCTPITAATTNTYTVQPSDVGSTIVAVVTGSNDGGAFAAPSAPDGPVLPLAPTYSVAPTITAGNQQGDTLSVSAGTWANSPTFTYIWEDCDTSAGTGCSTIANATSSSYTLQPSDVGSWVVAVVTGSNADAAVEAASAPSAQVLPLAPTYSVTPVITANQAPRQGDTVSVSTGTWANSPTFTYTWEDCGNSAGTGCSTIANATSSSYTLQPSDVGSWVVAVVTGSNADAAVAAVSAPSGQVIPLAPTYSVAPTITAGNQQGDTLTVSNGAWSNNPAFTYAWEDCGGSKGTNCSAIAGATSSTYALQASDVGSYVIAMVTGTNAGGQLSVPSAPTGQVLPATPVDTNAPSIGGGNAQQGVTLTATPGAWQNSPTFSYAWEDCTSSAEASCSAIAGANLSTYTLQASDVNKYVGVIVTAKNAGGSAQVTSAAVGPVLPPAPVNTKAPTIAGTAEQGDTLNVSNGSWSNSAPPYAYAWEQCNSAGSSCSAITGATSNSYALSAADVGHTIMCVVTATGAGGSTSTKTSKTTVVLPSPIPVASQPTTTNLLVTPNAPVTNQSVTLIATVTAGTSSTALWGDVTFQSGGAPIGGCSNMAVAPSGLSATVACSTSFSASSPQLSAVFTPTSGSILKGSSGSAGALTVGRDASAISLNAATAVNVGTSTTYTVTVTPPAARPGPVEPTGAVEFLDGGQPIGSCANQLLANGQATCSVTYPSTGTHDISALYSGDANFSGSTSPTAQVSATAVPTTVQGTIASTMQWQFYYTPGYTLVRALVVNGVTKGATVIVKCHGHGCPFASHVALVPTGKKCGKKGSRMCSAGGSFNVTPGFAGRRLKVGAHITISIMQPNWVGKHYSFTVRARRGPSIQIGCLAPGSASSAVGC